jgi:hypothetical protein
MYIIRRGIENVRFLHSSICDYYCRLAAIQAGLPFSTPKIQKNRKGNERERRERKYYNHSEAFLYKLKHKNIQGVIHGS